MKDILKRLHDDNPFDHDVERYMAIGNTKFQASCSRGQLKRHGWMVMYSIHPLHVAAFRRLR